MARVTVIIPTWNRASWLPLAIESVHQQTYSDYQLVIVNDGSTDATSDVLYHYPTLTSYHFSKNQGVSAARNWGIQHSDSEWIAFLDSDDQWHPKKLEKQMRQVESDPTHRIYFTDEIWIRHGKRVNPMKKHRKQEGWIFQASLALCLMAPSSVLIHRSVFEICGFFDENLPVCEDYDLWLRMTARYPVRLLNEKLMIRYGGHPDQLSNRSWGNDRYRVYSLINILKNIPLPPSDRQAVIEKLIEKCEILIQGFKKRHKNEEAQPYLSILRQYAMSP